MVYLTDGSFEGLLTAVFEAFEKKEDPEEIYFKDTFQISLISEFKDIITDGEKADRVYRAIDSKISRDVLEMVYGAYLSEDPGCGAPILYTLRLGFKMGGRVKNLLQNPHVLKVHDLNRRVQGEKHRFLGLLRFKKWKNGVFYAPFEPDCNVITLVAGHFVDRLSDQPWIIHDLKRSYYALYDTRDVLFFNGDLELPHGEDADEEYELLWKKYFQVIAIEHRKNPKLQRAFMPKKYWKHLVEKR